MCKCLQDAISELSGGLRSVRREVDDAQVWRGIGGEIEGVIVTSTLF